MSKGIVFEIEEFAVHDGPGIRKTVFLKGCPLRCNWCHNPEGISFKPELMVRTGSCTGCGKCAAACMHGDPGPGPVTLLPYRKAGCLSCGECVKACPLRLRVICGTEWESESLARELLRGKEILERSHGGITFSGGEPMAQLEFLMDLADRLKPMHLAVETSGHAPEDVFQAVAGKMDLVMMDIKHTDPEVHRNLTGVDNRLILKNLFWLCRSGKPFIIRIPMIPGITDTRENLWETARLLKDAAGLERVELLPYHKTAGAKYVMVGQTYAPAFNINQEPEMNLDPFMQYGISVVVL